MSVIELCLRKSQKPNKENNRRLDGRGGKCFPSLSVLDLLSSLDYSL